MSVTLKPYPAYKDSGSSWIGEVPSPWLVLPNRALFAEVNDRDHPDEPLLSVTIAQGIVRQVDLLADSAKKDSSNENKSNYKLVQPEDIAYNKMRAWQGAIGVSDYRGIVSPAYVVVRLREPHNPRYFHYLFRTPAFAKEAERWSYGIVSDQWSLRPNDFKQIYCPLPSRVEQDAIVGFLDQHDRHVRRFIQAKRRLIALLNEQKQAIIHQAVTRGLDPDVCLKPSGIEWLGNVPEHWEVYPANYFYREVDERSATGSEEILSVSHITGVTPRSQKNITMFMASSYVGHKLCQRDDLVIT
ncbi:MAG TPA: restriction endonuclease subunit S [Herpetosiphonaceae bacterium]|nr:restriction endonuclease subunit S [Herpetosiphonaceae bacterium]